MIISTHCNKVDDYALCVFHVVSDVYI